MTPVLRQKRERKVAFVLFIALLLLAGLLQVLRGSHPNPPFSDEPQRSSVPALRP